MIRLSKLTDYAVVVMAQLDRSQGGGATSAAVLAQDVGLPEPTVAKVLKILAGGGLVQSQRGASGGYLLARQARDISVLDMITVMEGSVALVSCVDGQGGGCSSEHKCPVRGHWDIVNDAVRDALSATSLADIAQKRACTKLQFVEDRTAAA